MRAVKGHQRRKTCPASYEKYIDWSTRNDVFSALDGSFTPLVVVTGLAEPERVLSDGCWRRQFAADPLVFFLAGGALVVITVLAGFLPAFQASRTDPLVVLRSE